MRVNMSAMNGQMKLPDASDFCTVAYAAEKIGMSMRQVRRLCAPGGPIRAVRPRTGSRESGRYRSLLLVDVGDQYAAAHRLVNTRADG
jgi:hypothetical protein